jgi:ubiquinone biosynthesis protein UbiJ
MTDSTATFFEDLAARGHEPALARVSGTLRFDVAEAKRTARWFVTIERGTLSVSHKNAKADCVVRADRPVVEGITSGRMNALTAVLRGAVEVDGDGGLLLAFQRLFPAPPRESS